MKKVIFIGGTAYSGSTFFDMILANDPNGFSCGEVYALFRPHRPHHINPECGCGQKGCTIWKTVLENGEKYLYQTILNLFTEKVFIVDSSKNPFWFYFQMNLLKKSDIESKNILIWKTPLETAYSFHKRNILKNWEKNWINYHRLYFTLIKNWKSVRYYDLSNNKSTLKKVCDYLEIPYFEGKERFWEKKMHTLFGNTSAKIHLYSQDSNFFKQSKNNIIHSSQQNESSIIKNHQKIYYNKVNDIDLENFVNDRMKKNSHFNKIIQILNKNDISRTESDLKGIENLKIMWLPLQFRKMKHFLFYRKS